MLRKYGLDKKKKKDKLQITIFGKQYFGDLVA